MLVDGVDWTRFARAAIACGLVSLAGHALIRVAPDLVPDDILDAFRATIDQTRQQNRVLLDTLLGVIDALSKAGIEAIPFNGPTLAIDAYGDLGLRRLSGNLDLFIRARRSCAGHLLYSQPRIRARKTIDRRAIRTD